MSRAGSAPPCRQVGPGSTTTTGGRDLTNKTTGGRDLTINVKEYRFVKT
jgi:hypothetical protein